MTNQRSEDQCSSGATLGGDAPTFSRDISPLFTQYDAIQMYYSFDLRSYEDVKAHADAIYLVVQEDPNHPGQSKLPDIPVMPLYEAPWTTEMVSTFKAWIDAGYPPGELPPPPPTPSPELPLFVALSEILTGLEGLDSDLELAQTYLDRLVAESSSGTTVEALLDVWSGISQLAGDELGAAVNQKVFADPQLEILAKEVILLWYNATIGGAFGTPESNQYTEALVWPTAQCHPMGWATENIPFYWQFVPEGSKYTGLRPPTAPQSGETGKGAGEEDGESTSKETGKQESSDV